MTDGEIEEFLVGQVVGRVGCHHDGLTYVVPVIFAWEAGCAYAYTTEGLKVELLRANPSACFEVDQYLPGGSWRSVIIQGTYEELTGGDAERTLQLLAERLASPSRQPGNREQRGGGRVPVAFRIRAGQVTGRRVDRTAV